MIADTGGKCKVYPGFGVGVGDGGTVKPTTPEAITAAVEAALDGGAHGILLSRNYSEAELRNLRAAGDVLKARGLW